MSARTLDGDLPGGRIILQQSSGGHIMVSMVALSEPLIGWIKNHCDNPSRVDFEVCGLEFSCTRASWGPSRATATYHLLRRIPAKVTRVHRNIVARWWM